MFGRLRIRVVTAAALGILAFAGPRADAQAPALPDASGGSMRDWLASAPVRTSLERLLERAQYGLALYETAAWVVRDCDDVVLREWTFSGAPQKATWNGAVPEGALAIVHTHPLRVDPRPSLGDAALARRLGLPVYTLTRRGLWVAQADGTILLEVPAPESCTRLACLPLCGAPSGPC